MRGYRCEFCGKAFDPEKREVCPACGAAVSPSVLAKIERQKTAERLRAEGRPDAAPYRDFPGPETGPGPAAQVLPPPSPNPVRKSGSYPPSLARRFRRRAQRSPLLMILAAFFPILVIFAMILFGIIFSRLGAFIMHFSF